MLNTGTITDLDNTGTIKNGGAGADAIDSVGSIGTLTNSGQIIGAVDLLGGSGDTLDNLGQISGNVALAGGDILSNQGQVYGDVTLASRDALTNTGAHPRRRDAGRVGHLRRELGRGHRGDHGLERRSPRIQRQFRP